MKLCLPMLTAGTVASVMVLSACSSPTATDHAKDSKPKAAQHEAKAAGTGDPTYMAAASSTCTYNSYSSFGPGEIVTRKGSGSNTQNDGYTDKHGRKLQLATGKLYDRSAGRLTHAKKGDKVWVDISHDKGKTWKVCGSVTKGNTIGHVLTSKIFIHSSGDVKNRYMRACAKTGDKTWCADIGNKSNKNVVGDNWTRYWWTDS
ncbi:MAG: hypothetical protein HOY76_07920 [Streptomyces sp.]|nr:hypothetical protein [Streptomyces sp.]NUS87223.1 hypothetical protein [Streptomyces sp.]